jgi:hypothetical protein
MPNDFSTAMRDPLEMLKAKICEAPLAVGIILINKCQEYV